ncbi:hypothetical protein EON67_01450 [archaeon]|nr:MAG: hypothetical protein EON67_01450 [archaeon]
MRRRRRRRRWGCARAYGCTHAYACTGAHAFAAEIKKLQRYRDNIKMWIASAEIKQKTPLEDARRVCAPLATRAPVRPHTRDTHCHPRVCVCARVCVRVQNIERKMEAFKVVERETKTKAYSREGLMRDTPLSAEERKRMKSREWVRDVVDKLSEQMDEMDADIERLGASSKRKDKETVAELEALVKSHRYAASAPRAWAHTRFP